MAVSPLKPCNRCKRNLTKERYCVDCAEIVNTQPVVSGNQTSSTERGYDWSWKKIRDRKLKIDPLCERCQAVGKTVPAVLVHHKDRNPKNNEPGNHEALCLSCHQLEHRLDGVKSVCSRKFYARDNC